MRRSSRLAAKANALNHPSPDTERASTSSPPPRAPRSKKQKQRPPLQPPQPPHESSISGDALMLIIKSISDKMDRWQAAASFALAGGFGPGWQEFLEPFWLEEAHLRYPDGNFLTGPFKTVQSRKKAAKIATMPVERLPQTVPPELVGVARRILLQEQVAAEIQALEGQEDINLNAHITQTRALSEYLLNLHDIADLEYETRRNPHYRSAAPMCLYTLRDIIETSYLKHGGAAGLEIARQKSEERKKKLRENKNNKLHQREEELKAALAQRGLQLRSDSHVCNKYIHGSNEKSLQQVVDIMHEMNFYFKHTKYADYHEVQYDEWSKYNWGPPDDSDKIEISEDAKSLALSDLKRRIGVEGILALPNLPPTIRREMERQQQAAN